VQFLASGFLRHEASCLKAIFSDFLISPQYLHSHAIIRRAMHPPSFMYAEKWRQLLGTRKNTKLCDLEAVSPPKLFIFSHHRRPVARIYFKFLSS